MRTIGSMVLVKYDLDNQKVFDLGGGIKIMRPDYWESEESEGKVEGNVNHLETNPQVAEVLCDSEEYGVKKGDTVFLHYMAFEWAEDMEIEGVKGSAIQGDYILFKIVNDQFEMIGDNYVGQRLFTEELILDWGLILNVDKRPVASTIDITHTPQEPKKERQHLNAGDKVITIDDNQYIFEYKGKKYVKLSGDEIVGTI